MKHLAYRYGLSMRPPSVGAVPKGFIPDPSMYVAAPRIGERFRWGYLDYPAKLSDEVAAAYEWI